MASVHRRPGAVSYIFHTAFDRGGDGFLTKQFTYQQHECALTNDALWVRIIRQAASYLGDRGGSTAGPGKVEVLEGILKKLD